MPHRLYELPAAARRVVVSVNPKAGVASAQDRVDQLVRLLDEHDLEPEISSDLDEVARMANQRHAEGTLRALVGVGGDGTAAELANRITPGLPLTMFPTGNENLFAGYLSLGRSPEEMCRTLVDGAVLRLDAGKAGGRVFLLMIGCGFDADVVHRFHHRRSGHAGNLHYVKPILSAIRGYQYPPIRVSWESEDSAGGDVAEMPTDLRWLFAFNLPCYGGGFRLAPRANGRDGLLDVCGFRRGSLYHGLKYAAAVRLGMHECLADCVTRRVRRLRLIADAEVRYQLDGDPGGVLPVEVEVLPYWLSMVIPRQRAEKLVLG